MKFEIGYPKCGALAGGRLARRRPQSLRVEAETETPGEYRKRPVRGRRGLADGQGLDQRLIVRAWELRYLADRSVPARGKGIEVPIIGELHDPERSRGSTTAVGLLDSDES